MLKLDFKQSSSLNKRYLKKKLTEEEASFIYLIGVYYILIGLRSAQVYTKMCSTVPEEGNTNNPQNTAQPHRNCVENFNNILANKQLNKIMKQFFCVNPLLERWEGRILNTIYFTNFLMLGNLAQIEHMAENDKTNKKVSWNWQVVFKESVFNLIEEDQQQKAVTSAPFIYQFFGKNSVKDVLNYKNYNRSIWIYKKALANWKERNESSLENVESTPQYMITVLNNLNKQAIQINETFLELLNKIFKKNKLPNTLTALLQTGDFAQQQHYLQCLNKLKGTTFYFTYVLDNRCRIYVKNIPVNYQLDKLCRFCIRLKSAQDQHARTISLALGIDFKDACLEIIKEFEGLKNLFSIIQKNDYNATIVKILELSQVNHEDCAELYKVLDLLIKLNRTCGAKNYENTALNIVKDLYQNGLEQHLEKNTHVSKIVEYIQLTHAIFMWLQNNTNNEIIVYNDVSCSALQLFALRSFCTTENTLRISNVWNNTTEHKDIYSYVEYYLKNELPEDASYISRTLVKSRVMPGVYGQKLLTFLKLADSIIVDSSWNLKPLKEKITFLKKADKLIWKALKGLNIDVEAYLTLCKNAAREEHIFEWFNLVRFPIQIKKEYRVNRQKLLANLKRGLVAKDEKKITKIKAQLAKDEKNYKRIHIKYVAANNVYKYIKLRLEKPTNLLDLANLANNIAASSNHADDASILIVTSQKLSKYEIAHAVIHDSIGTNLAYSLIVKFLYKESVSEYLDWLLKEVRFPFNILNKNTKFMQIYAKNRAYYMNNADKIKKEIMRSKGLID